MTCDEDEAAVEGEEGADAVEEVLEVDLVLDEGRRAVGGTELHEPAGEIYTHLLVPEPPTMEESAGAGEGGRRTHANERGFWDSLEVVERQLLLAGVENVPQVLDPHGR